MEAKASYNFDAANNDEMSFRKGALLKVVNRDDTDWYTAECEGRQGLVPSNYIDLADPEWYKGKITRLTAEEILLKMTAHGDSLQPDGAFLVRKSEGDKNGHSLSVKHGHGVQHFKILQDKSLGKYHLWKKTFNSINELVNYYRTNSVSREPQSQIFLRDMQPETTFVCKCRALYTFNPSDEDTQELGFNAGDVMNIQEKLDDNWWTAELNGAVGLIPKNYVQEI